MAAERITSQDEAARRVIEATLEESIRVKQAVLAGPLDAVVTAAAWMRKALESGGKILLCGNGGSAADAQHIAAEFVGRFERERRGWPAIALTTDTSALTAIGNDYGVEAMFSRQVEALGRPGDVLLAFSTSGGSPNILRAVETARELGIRTVGFTGGKRGALESACDLCVSIPCARTARVQEAHITLCHALCEIVETALVEGGAHATG